MNVTCNNVSFVVFHSLIISTSYDSGLWLRSGHWRFISQPVEFCWNFEYGYYEGLGCGRLWHKAKDVWAFLIVESLHRSPSCGISAIHGLSPIYRRARGVLTLQTDSFFQETHIPYFY